MPKVHELQERRAAVVVEMRTLADTAAGEKRDLNETESAAFDKLKADIVALDKQIERAKFLEAQERSAPAVVSADNLNDGDFETRARKFSLQKAIRAALPKDIGGGGVDAGFENEISQEVQRRSGRAFQGLAVPDEIFSIERRTLLAGSSAEPLIPTIHRSDLFVNRLRSAIVVERLGATVLDGLQGIIDIPRQVSSSSAQWVGEDGSLSETDATFDDVTLSPKTVGAMTSYSRRTLINSSPSIENILRSDLAKVLANAIDEKALLGDGTSNTPTGIVHHPDVTEFEIGAPSSGLMTWQDVLDMIGQIEGDDVELDGMGWVLNAKVKAKLRGAQKVTGHYEPGFIMPEPGELAGYRVATTSAMPGSAGQANGKVIFGKFSDMLIGRWSGVDLLLNPYETTAYAKGRVLIRAMQDVDIQIRHGESFTFAEDLSA